MSTITRILSGKDGVGKSTVTALVGEQLALMGRKVLLIEFENGLRCLDLYVGATATKVYDLDDLLNGRCGIDDAVAVSALSGNLSVIFATNSRRHIDPEQFSTLVLALSDSYDHIIIDTDCSEESIDCLSGFAMNSIVISTSDPSGTRDAKFVCDRLFSQNVPGVKVLFNRVRKEYIADKIVPDLDYSMDMIGVPLIGVVPELADIVRCTAKGSLPKNKTLTQKIFKSIALRLEGESVPLTVI
ncbi:MAG: AAA family ATPase [Oscillospiraceae bacterium]|nr:AAA family ATPase [Oscillospiraceae bacterium]